MAQTKLRSEQVDVTGGGLTNFTEGVNNSAPNATVPVVYLIPNTGDTNNDAVFGAKGTGAILAQVPDSTAAGGLKRGPYAVDWQHNRNLAAEVASGAASVISGGYRNKNDGSYSVIAGGYLNYENAGGSYNAIGGGAEHIIDGVAYSVISGGYSHSTGSNYTTISGGRDNDIPSYTSEASTISGGRSNIVSASPYAHVGGYHGRVYMYAVNTFGTGPFSANGDNQWSEAMPKISTAGLGTGATTIVRLDGSGTTHLMAPYTDNRIWNCTVKIQAVVVATSGTTTGVVVGDAWTRKDEFTLIKVGGTSSILDAVEKGTPRDSASMNACDFNYTIGGSNDLISTFTAPTFAGGGTLTIRVSAYIHIAELAW